MQLESINFALFDVDTIELDFSNKKIQDKKPKISVVVGPNGTGKSHVLKKIADVFRNLHNVLNNKISTSNENFELKYKYNNEHIQVDEKNFKHQKFSLPSNVMVLSYLLEDKFTYSAEDDGFYIYLGIRTATNVSYTKNYAKRTFLNLFGKLQTDNHIFLDLKYIIDFLGYSDLRVIYPFKKIKTLMASNITIKSFKERFNTISKNEKSINHSKASKISEDDLQEALSLLKKYRGFDSEKKAGLIINVTSEGMLDINPKALETMSLLEYIDPPFIELKKYDNDKSSYYSNFSTGENNILLNAINLMTYIKNDSLILIDEPEVSLHPNWQMQYIRLIRHMIEGTSAHVIIATHSHFLVSDLDPNDSTLHALVFDKDGKRKIEKIEYSTQMWSSDAILYRVFNVRDYSSFAIK